MLFSLKPGYCEISDSSIQFQPVGLDKQTCVHHNSSPIQVGEFEGFLLYPIIHVEEYIRRTEAWRKTLMLLEPCKAAQRVTVAEWLSKVIMLSGQKGTPGSIRSGSWSHVIMRGVDLAMMIGLMLPHLKSLLLIRAIIFYEESLVVKIISGMALFILLEAKKQG